MHKIYSTTVGLVRRVPAAERVGRAALGRLPAPAKRNLRRARHRLFMRSPRSMLARVITPGVQNRLLSSPAVVERLLATERARELMSHQPSSSGKNVDWVAQVARNDPASVVATLRDLATTDARVAAALDGFAAGREPVLSQEQIVDVFLGLAEFERREYWTNPRIRDAMLDHLCRDRNLPESRQLLGERMELLNASIRVRAVVGEGDSPKPITFATEEIRAAVEPPVAADIILSMDVEDLDALWDIESFRSSFIANLLGEDDLFRLRTLLRAERFEDPAVRQALFDVLSGAQPYQLMTDGSETIILPSADLGFAKAFWADRGEQLAHLDRFVAARQAVGRDQCGWFLDIGSNIATHTVHAIRGGAFDAGVSVEPDPRLLPVLKANLALNELDACVHVVDAAAGASDSGSVSFWCSDVNWGDNRLTTSAGEGWHEITVPIRTVDRIIEEIGIDPTQIGALWVDVQGHEGDVLLGARAVIGGGCDIVVEFWPSVLSKEGRLESTLELLEALSARWLDLETGELVDRDDLLGMQAVGLELGEAYYVDLALVHGLTDTTK